MSSKILNISNATLCTAFQKITLTIYFITILYFKFIITQLIMDPEPNRFFLAFIIFFLFTWKVSHAEQYYDPQTRRYIELEQNVTQQPAQLQQVQRQRYPQRVIPTQSEIEMERQKVAKQRAIEAQMEIEARNMGNKRFDPSRFHKTEDVGFY